MIKAHLAGITRVDPFLLAVLADEMQAMPLWLEWENWWPLDDMLRGWTFVWPSSFRLMSDLIDAAGGVVEDIGLYSVNGDVIEAAIRLSNGKSVNAKPADALTLSVIRSLPISIAESVMEIEGVPIPDDLRGQPLDDAALKRLVEAARNKRCFCVDRVVEGLYISGVRRQPFPDRLREQGITSVLKLYSHPMPWPDDFVVFDNGLEDGILAPIERLQRGVEFIRDQRAHDRKVLVLCWEGMSRSSTFVLAYLVQELGYDLREAWETLRAAHPKAFPAHQMWMSLIEHYGLSYTIEDVKVWLNGNGKA
jgi:bifunctional DNase/RNase